MQAPAERPPAAPAVVAPPPGHPRFPLMDSVRGIAVLMVITAHAAVATGAWQSPVFAHINVVLTIFFVLSSFLLYRPFIAWRTGGARAPRFRDYGRGRVLRVVPGYWFALTLLAIYPGVLGPFSDDWWAFYGLLQYYPFLDAAGACGGYALEADCGISIAWSLAIEVAFYALLPLLVLGLNRLARGRPPSEWLRLELIVLAGLGLLSLGARRLAFTDPDFFIFSYTLVGTFLWIALGMGLAAVSVAFAGREDESRLLSGLAAHPSLVWGVALTMLVAMSAFVPTPLGQLVLPGGLLAQVVEHIGLGVVAVLLVIPAVFSGDRPGVPRSVLTNPLLTWIGLISYGLFLWHVGVQLTLYEQGVTGWIPGASFLVLTVTSLVVATACAAVSYYLIERPCLGLKYQRRGSRKRATSSPPHVPGTEQPVP